MKLSVPLLALALPCPTGPIPTSDGCAPAWIAHFGGEPGLGDQVDALATFDDGRGPALYVGGAFTSAGGVQALSVARWDGTRWSALGGGLDGTVKALEVFDDGNGPCLHAGGSFTAAGGAPASRIARWDGTAWSALGSGTNDTVRALTVCDVGGDLALHAAGAFTVAGGLGASRIARWDGAGWSPLGSGLDNEARALAVYDDGHGPRLYAGGRFLTAGGVAASRIARWNGASWASVGGGMDEAVHALFVCDAGGGARLHAGGAFASAGGTPAQRIASWNGTSWSALEGGVGPLAFGLAVNALGGLDDGGGPALFAGGRFSAIDPAPGQRVSAYHLARWRNGWSPLGRGLDYTASDLALFDDGSGPALHTIRAVRSGNVLQPGRQVARWTGTGWEALAGAFSPGVKTIAVHDDGSGPALYAGGAFTAADGAPASHIARWDGSSWSDVGGGIDGLVRALAVYDDGSGPALYAGGSFQSAGGLPASGIARWNGAAWAPLGSGVPGAVLALAVVDEGAPGGAWLAIGGNFASSTRGDSYLARWHGCPDTLPPTLDGPEAVLVTDSFLSPGGETVNFVVTASDGHDPAPMVLCVPPSGSFFPLGTTLVHCQAWDASGNSASHEFPVTVTRKSRRR